MKLTIKHEDHNDREYFQYPQPRVYAMKPVMQETTDNVTLAFSTLNLGSTR